MYRHPHLVRLALATLLGALTAGTAMAQSSSFPQYEKTSCPSRFTTSGGKCTANEPGWIGMINPNGKQSCPSGFTRSTNYCTKKVGDDKAAKKGDTGKSAGASHDSSNEPSPESSFGGKPAVKRVTKRDPLDYCPTGYHTSVAVPGDCITPWPDAPEVSVKKGSCPAGTTEEQGQYCTGPTTLALKYMDAAHTRDFNALYVQRTQKGRDTSSANQPAVFAQASDAAKSAQASPTPEGTVAPAEAPATTATPTSDSQDAKAAAKALGSAIKGLFSR